MNGRLKKCVVVLCGVAVCVHAMQVIDLPRDEQGWTLLSPSQDSRIVYVSSSRGSDATGVVYHRDSAAVGSDPFHPAGDIQPFESVSAALDETRSGYPDWVLFKKGDVWYSSCSAKNGRATDEMFLVSSYGTGERPLFKTGTETGLSRCCSELQYMAIVGLHFYAHTRDPENPDYGGTEGATGSRLFEGTLGGSYGILIEDCVYEYYVTNLVLYRLRDFVLRRCIILDAYNTGGHSQGIFASALDSAIIEQTFFDHNGWLVQSSGNGRAADNGQATIYNHNTYFSSCNNVTFRENVFSRSSSIQNKWRSDEPGKSSALVCENNLYLDGEIGISMGGNTSEAHRYVQCSIEDNVFVDIGRSQPTNRTLAWYIDASDWDGGRITGNICAHQYHPDIANAYGINLQGASMRNVTVRENIIHDIKSNGGLIRAGDTQHENIAITNNYVQSPTYAAWCMSLDNAAGLDYTIDSNTYYSARAPSEWFRAGATAMSLADWQSTFGATHAETLAVDYPAPQRNADSYARDVLGRDSSFSAFYTAMRTRAKSTWNEELTTRAILSYIREGFGQSTSVSPARAEKTAPVTGHMHIRYDRGMRGFVLQADNNVRLLTLHTPDGRCIQRVSVPADGDDAGTVTAGLDTVPPGVYIATLFSGDTPMHVERVFVSR
jgi:hypothetical protein